MHASNEGNARPTSAVKLSLATIPKSLKQLNRWVLWAYTLKANASGNDPDDYTKVPYSPTHGGRTDATKLSNGCDFVTAVQALKKGQGRYDGLGFLLGEGIAGIDVDDCIDENGMLDLRGQTISEQYAATYAEVSPSGTGFKILVDIGDDARLAVIGKNTRELEVYGSKRYFAVTGNLLPGHAQAVASMAQAFDATAASIGVDTSRQLTLVDMPVNNEQKRGLGIDMVAARELLDHLPFHWCETYLEWIKAGMALHHEFDGSADALALWDEWSQRSRENYDPHACADKWRTFGRPGKTTFTVRSLVYEAEATGWRSPTTINRALRDFTAFDLPEVLEPDEDGVYSEPPDWWHRYSIGNMLRLDAPAKRWIWKGLLQVGKVLVLAGSGGSSKSYLMLGAAVQFALDANWGPFEAQGNPDDRVLLLYGEEDANDVHDRVRALRHSFMLGDDDIAKVEQRVAIMPLRGKHVELVKHDRVNNEVHLTEQLTKLEERIKGFGVRLVILDPLAMFHDLEENDNGTIKRLVHELDSMCQRADCAMVIVHHFGKSGATTARDVNEQAIRGASSLVAHARTAVVMHRLTRDEASSWGVNEEDHARWVLFKVVKNNYGPSGSMFWFVIDGTNGSIAPSPTQLTYMNSTNIREAARQHAEAVAEEEITATQARLAADAAMRQVEELNLKRTLLRIGKNMAGVPSITKSGAALRKNGFPNCADSRARKIRNSLLNDGLIHNDGVLTEAGDDWLSNQEWLNGIEPE